VTARYICQGGATEASHLWVSVKQTADRSPDNAQGRGQQRCLGRVVADTVGCLSALPPEALV
jgi:hypothetical protein